MLFLLGLAEPLFGLARVLHVHCAHVLTHGRSRLSHVNLVVYNGMVARNVVTETHPTRPDMPALVVSASLLLQKRCLVSDQMTVAQIILAQEMIAMLILMIRRLLSGYNVTTFHQTILTLLRQ